MLMLLLINVNNNNKQSSSPLWPTTKILKLSRPQTTASRGWQDEEKKNEATITLPPTSGRELEEDVDEE